MGDNPSFESQDLFSEKENTLSLSPRNTGSKLTSVQPDKLLLYGYGKAPRFGKSKCNSQPAAVKEMSGEHHSRMTFPPSQPSRRNPIPQRQRLSSPMQDKKKTSYSQEAVKDMIGEQGSRKTLPASQPSRGNPRPQSQGFSRASQDKKRISFSHAAVMDSKQGRDLSITSQAMQPSRRSPRLNTQVLPSSTQDSDIPDFNSKDKMYWYLEFKRVKAVNSGLTKRLERLSEKFGEVGEQVKVLSNILK